MDCIKDPVIIMGMHRSGTTMLAQCLEKAGLFIGSDLQGDAESRFFLGINDLVMEKAGARWDSPAPMKYLLADGGAADMLVKCMEEDVASSAARGYLGLKNYLRYGSAAKLNTAWGWKDPRNVFTLKLWLRLFPGAKVIYITRSGVDVAASLAGREQACAEKRDERFKRRFGAASPGKKLKAAAINVSSRCRTLDGAFSLWEEYVEQAEGELGGMGKSPLILRYEDVVADPDARIGEAIEFALGPGARGLKDAAALVKKDKTGPRALNPKVAELYNRVKDSRWMRHYGY